MRRGKNNRWAYDRSPESDGLVTVCKDGTTRHFHSIEELQAYNNGPASISEKMVKRLQKLGVIS